MRTPLDIGIEITLYEIGTANKGVFRITEFVGMDSSCTVYIAVYTDAEGNVFSVRLKEFCPLSIDISREEASLVISESCSTEFDAMLSCFTSG